MFSVIEGSVDTKSTLSQINLSASTSTSVTVQATSPKSGKLSRLIAFCNSLNANNFNIKIYRLAAQTRTSLLLESSTTDGTIDVALNLSFIAPENKFYVIISHDALTNADFDIHLDIELTKSI